MGRTLVEATLGQSPKLSLTKTAHQNGPINQERLMEGPVPELTRYRRGLGAWSDWEDAQMVSTDHFRHELLAQLGRAATQGRIDVLINLGELCRSITRGSSRSASCCDAMQEEFKMGDTLLLDRTTVLG
jgi:hypothetical protein